MSQLGLVLERLKLVFLQLMDGGSICGIDYPAARIDSKVFKCRSR